MATASVRCPVDCGPRPAKHQCLQGVADRPFADSWDGASSRWSLSRPGAAAQMSGSRGCNTRYSGRSGDWDKDEEATAPAISWSGADFGMLTPLPPASRGRPATTGHPQGDPSCELLASMRPHLLPALCARCHIQAFVSSLICQGRKPRGRPVYPAKSPVVPRYAAKLLDKLGREGTAKPTQPVDVVTNF
jgi:hypothetical protein